jgi:hypothetical protein
MMGLGAAITGVMAFFKTSSVWRAGVAVAFYIALKTILVTLLTVVLAVVLHNFVLTFVLEFMQTMLAGLPDSTLSEAVFNLTGVAGYIGNQLRLPECMSVFTACLSVAGIRRIMPF